MTVGIIDIAMGNIGSVSVALRELGFVPKLVKAPADFRGCDALILPGVGAFPEAMSRLTEGGFVCPIQRWASNGNRLVGICLEHTRKNAQSNNRRYGSTHYPQAATRNSSQREGF